MFFGCIYDVDGVHPDPVKVSIIDDMKADPVKVNAIHVMKALENDIQLREFCGMITNLEPFIVNLSTYNTPLHEVLKRWHEFTWNSIDHVACDKLKLFIYDDTTLR